MKSFSVKTTIQSSPQAIWSLLTDAQGYPDWNPTVIRIEGRIAPGERIKIFSTVQPKRAFPATVVRFSPEEEMVWSDAMPLGLFKGERTYRLTVRGDGVEFSMEEVFSGLLSPLIGRAIPDLQPSFEAFAVALKARAEAMG